MKNLTNFLRCDSVMTRRITTPNSSPTTCRRSTEVVRRGGFCIMGAYPLGLLGERPSLIKQKGCLYGQTNWEDKINQEQVRDNRSSLWAKASRTHTDYPWRYVWCCPYVNWRLLYRKRIKCHYRSQLIIDEYCVRKDDWLVAHSHLYSLLRDLPFRVSIHL